MVLKLEFTDGHEPWISFPMNREEALNLWNKLSKMKMKGVCSFNEYIGYLQSITGNAKLFWKYQF